MGRSTYPVWIGSDTASRLSSNGTGHRTHLVVDHGRQVDGDPTITLVGSVLQLHRLVMEADRKLTRWRLGCTRVL